MFWQAMVTEREEQLEAERAAKIKVGRQVRTIKVT
jgi:hypothetical protein